MTQLPTAAGGQSYCPNEALCRPSQTPNFHVKWILCYTAGGQAKQSPNTIYLNILNIFGKSFANKEAANETSVESYLIIECKEYT